MFLEVGSTKIALHDGIAPQVQHAQHAVTHVNKQFSSIGVKLERVDHITLHSKPQIKEHCHAILRCILLGLFWLFLFPV